MKAAPTMLQSLPPPTTFSVPAQAPPPSLLQAQLSAASLAPLLQNPPQPLLPQPPPKGTVLVSGIYLAFPCKAVWTTSNDECYLCCCFGTTFEHRIVCVVRKWFAFLSLPEVFPGGLLQPPVRMMAQPQPVRRIEPPPRFPTRSDRGPELILRTKEERRWDGRPYNYSIIHLFHIHFILLFIRSNKSLSF